MIIELVDNRAEQLSLGTSAGKPSNLNISPESLADSSLAQRYKLLSLAQELVPENKSLCECQYAPVPETTFVTVNHDPETKRTTYGNLQTCGFVMCPFCAWKTAYRDRIEMAVALAEMKKQGNFPVLVTFTMSHGLHDTLNELITDLNEAYNKTISGRWFMDLQADWLLLGRIKALEVTYNRNGHHPHLHVLFESELEIEGVWCERLAKEIGERFIKQLKKIGRHATLMHGVNVRTADSDVADYIAKFGREPIAKSWGAEAEMTLSNAKTSSVKGLTPFQILSAYGGNSEIIDRLSIIWNTDDVKEIRRRAGALYREYFFVMKGRHRLRWSKGMKGRLNIEQGVKDYHAQNDPTPHGIPVVMLPANKHGWLKVARRGLRGKLIDVVARANIFEIERWLIDHDIRYVITDIGKELSYSRIDF